MLARVALWTCNQMERHTSALMNVRSVMIAQRAIKMTAPTAAENWFGALGEAFILRANKGLLQKSKLRIGPACFGERASGSGPSFRWLLPLQFTNCIARSMAGCAWEQSPAWNSARS